LTATCDDFAKGARFFVGHRPGDGTNRLGKERDDASVESVGLGQLPGCPGEVADLSGGFTQLRVTRASQCGGDRDLVAAASFKNHDGGSERADAGVRSGHVGSTLVRRHG
jgi:hypothetical protein